VIPHLDEGARRTLIEHGSEVDLRRTKSNGADREAAEDAELNREYLIGPHYFDGYTHFKFFKLISWLIF